MEHVTNVEPRAAEMNDGEHYIASYRWRCSCGQTGVWKPREFQARQGASKHVSKLLRSAEIRGAE